jgi:hypothetical protein
MKKQFKLISFIILSASLVFTACSKDNDDEPDDQQNEFIADNSTFTDFRDWVKEAENQGSDPALGPAHAGNDSTVVRSIYFKDGQDRVNGQYPLGTIIVKEGLNSTGSFQEITAMVKRGNNFNTNGGDWEWFVLKPDGTIAEDGDGNAMRGANLMGGMCIGCHTEAADRDYAFSKP